MASLVSEDNLSDSGCSHGRVIFASRVAHELG